MHFTALVAPQALNRWAGGMGVTPLRPHCVLALWLHVCECVVGMRSSHFIYTLHSWDLNQGLHAQGTDSRGLSEQEKKKNIVHQCWIRAARTGSLNSCWCSLTVLTCPPSLLTAPLLEAISPSFRTISTTWGLLYAAYVLARLNPDDDATTSAIQYVFCIHSPQLLYIQSYKCLSVHANESSWNSHKVHKVFIQTCFIKQYTLFSGDNDIWYCFSSVFSRGAACPLPVPARLSGVVVGRTPYGLQTPVDAHPLRHLQLPAGELIDLIVCLHACFCVCVCTYSPSFVDLYN